MQFRSLVSRATLCSSLGLLPLPALAAGTSNDWAPACATGSLLPDPGGRTFYVATSGTDPGTCPAPGFTFKTIHAAVNCAQSRDTVYVRGGSYPKDYVSGRHFSAPVLITNYTGEQPILDGTNTPPTSGDYDAILKVTNSSYVSIQGLLIQDTGNLNPTNCSNGGIGAYGVQIATSDHINFYKNTVQDTARQGIVFDGSTIDVIGNIVTRAAFRNKNFVCDNAGSYHDGAITGTLHKGPPNTNSSNLRIINNDVHEVWGECITLADTDTGTVNGNRVYNCESVSIYIDRIKNSQISRNWITVQSDTYSKGGIRPTGIQLSNESSASTLNDGYSIANIQISSNIIEKTFQGTRFANWKTSPGDPGTPDTYSNLTVAFNDINATIGNPSKIDEPVQGHSGVNYFRQNIVVNTSGLDWVVFGNWSGWDVSHDDNLSNGTTLTNPGWVSVSGGATTNYMLRDDSINRSTAPHSSEPYIPRQDLFCNDRTVNTVSSAGAHEHPN